MRPVLGQSCTRHTLPQLLERWRSNLGGALGSQAGFRTRGDAKKGGSVFGSMASGSGGGQLLASSGVLKGLTLERQQTEELSEKARVEYEKAKVGVNTLAERLKESAASDRAKFEAAGDRAMSKFKGFMAKKRG